MRWKGLDEMEGPQEKKTPPERILECRVEEYLHQFRWSGYKFVPSVENWMTAIYSQVLFKFF